MASPSRPSLDLDALLQRAAAEDRRSRGVRDTVVLEVDAPDEPRAHDVVAQADDRDRAPDEHEDARPRPIAREEEQGRRDPHDEGAHDGHERRHRGHGAQERGLGHAGHREAGARDGSLGERGPEVADDHSATEPLRLAKEPARMVRVDGHEAHGAPGEFGPVPRDEEHRRGREEEREQGLEERARDLGGARREDAREVARCALQTIGHRPGVYAQGGEGGLDLVDEALGRSAGRERRGYRGNHVDALQDE
jgi:hypothetical protein